MRKCEHVYLWAVTAPSHPSFGADPSHQCSNRPNGQTVPRLAVWTVGAIGGDALKIPPSTDSATSPNRGVTRHPRRPARQRPPGQPRAVGRDS